MKIHAPRGHWHHAPHARHPPHLNTRTPAPWHSPRATSSPLRSPCTRACGGRRPSLWSRRSLWRGAATTQAPSPRGRAPGPALQTLPPGKVLAVHESRAAAELFQQVGLFEGVRSSRPRRSFAAVAVLAAVVCGGGFRSSGRLCRGGRGGGGHRGIGRRRFSGDRLDNRHQIPVGVRAEVRHGGNVVCLPSLAPPARTPRYLASINSNSASTRRTRTPSGTRPRASWSISGRLVTNNGGVCRDVYQQSARF